CLTFATRNSESLDVFFLVGAPVSLPVALWFGLMLALGCAIGLLAGVMSVLSKKRKIRRLQKALDELEKRSGRLP
ncbi:LapA family protein, partial [Wenyingzhuangia sp. 1_MG-2023]|nr:LapA family protein [Wenyingzhuangia sp. 1_MG-2023]